MLQLAVERLEGLIPPERVFVVTSADLVEATCACAPRLPRENVIGEPFGRDTAAACALGSALVKARDPAAAFAILTADQVIGEPDRYRETLKAAFALALGRDVLVTIGITPAFASTGYGYIEAGEELDAGGTVAFRKAIRFVEKPDAATAEKYVASGDFFWNSGMFIWSVPAFQKALGQHAAPWMEMAERMLPCVGTAGFDGALEREYGRLEKLSIDYALMEKAENIVMAQGTFPWDDVGAWPALANHFAADAGGNVVVGQCEAEDAAGNIVVSGDRLTVLIGVRDLVVVHAPGASLVCPKDRAQEVKQIVRRLAEAGGFDELL
jgi:mannose-1-phosphate guanylyltransferase